MVEVSTPELEDVVRVRTYGRAKLTCQPRSASRLPLLPSLGPLLDRRSSGASAAIRSSTCGPLARYSSVVCTIARNVERWATGTETAVQSRPAERRRVRPPRLRIALAFAAGAGSDAGGQRRGPPRLTFARSADLVAGGAPGPRWSSVGLGRFFPRRRFFGRALRRRRPFQPRDLAAAGDGVEAVAGVFAEGVQVVDFEALAAVTGRQPVAVAGSSSERISPTQRSP